MIGSKSAGLDVLLDRFGLTDEPYAGGTERFATAIKGLCQTFVDTFATGDVRYRVSFDNSSLGAGTSVKDKLVRIGTDPIFDPNLTPREVGRIMCGLAAHETGHIRDRDLIVATADAYRDSPQRPEAQTLSNILDDVLSEKEFVKGYPGYRNIFQPTLEYIAKAGGDVAPTAADPLQVCVAAVRYDPFVTWNASLETDRRWWQEWGEQYTGDTSVRTHLAGIAAGLERLKSNAAKGKPEPDKSGDESGASGDESGESGESGGEDGDESGEDESGDESTSGGREQRSGPLPVCMGTAIQRPDATLEAASSVPEGEGQVYANPRNVPLDDDEYYVKVETGEDGRLRHVKVPPKANEYTQGVIRDELIRSRTGNKDEQSRRKSGMLDNSGIHRLAMGDARIFSKRRNPDPGRYNIWMLADNSSSMAEQRTELAETGHSIAVASRHVKSLRLSFWAWSAAMLGQNPRSMKRRSFSVARLWQTGGDPKDIWKLGRVAMGGTPDAHVMRWGIKAILAETRQGETPVILMMSDGSGSPDDEGKTVADHVKDARRKGIKVVGISMGESIGQRYLDATYGNGNYIAWKGSIRETAKPIAKLLGSLTQGLDNQARKGRL